MSAQPSLTSIGTVSKPNSLVPRLHILVGIPGCGKSTFASSLTNCSTKLVSSDDLRAEIAKDVNDQSQNELVFKVFHNMIKFLLSTGYDVVADSTALDGFAREKLRRIAEGEHADTHLYFFKNPQEALQRNRTRERCVPMLVMQRMLDKYERACLEIPHEQYASTTEIRSFA